MNDENWRASEAMPYDLQALVWFFISPQQTDLRLSSSCQARAPLAGLEPATEGARLRNQLDCQIIPAVLLPCYKVKSPPTNSSC
ncbi:hypothetical protein PoB_000393900 [Plakobranchus ocellatus]|uniref:Uncharacterized protein n=1 Tax=Plakobranchus ocellatus TaxID=259542 RepID=A0AAV3Y5C7_9GAST|nr:hypothetical protein PoB_000393900 [Plakobranchus ocellatus]